MGLENECSSPPVFQVGNGGDSGNEGGYDNLIFLKGDYNFGFER